MNAYETIMEILAVFFFCFLLFANAQAEEPALEEWVDVNVLVNILDANDANNSDIKAIIKEANLILEKTKIRLILKKINKNIKIGDGDSDLAESETLDTVVHGEKELQKVFGAGKGIKITAANDVSIESPNTVGWNIHRNPVVVIETSLFNAQLGEVLSHEIGHFLTLEHVDDSNNLMSPFTPNGQDLSTSQIDEIFKEMKKRGKTYLRKPQPLPTEFELGPSGLEYGIEGFGAILDIPGDVSVLDLSTGTTTETDDPKYKYADLGEILVYMENAFDPSGILNIQVHLSGLMPPPNQIDFFTDISIFNVGDGEEPEFPADATVSIHRSLEGLWDAELFDPDFFGLPLDEPRVHENERFDVGLVEELINQTVELDVPIELINEVMDGRFDPGGSNRILIMGNTYSADYRNDPFLATIVQDDSEFFFLNVIGQPPGPELEFIHNGVAGSGFALNTEVVISLDNNKIDSVLTSDNGSFESVFPFLREPLPGPGNNTPLPPLRSGVHSVLIIENDDSGPHGAAHAIGFFEQPAGQVGDDGELINGALSLDNHSTAFDPGDSRAPAGVFTCTAAFTNITDTSFSNVFFKVNTLTGGNTVLNALDGGGEGSRIAAPAVLNPGESFVSEFEIGLENPRPFEFFVNAFGIPGGGEHSGDPIDLTPQYSFQPPPFILALDTFDDPPGPVVEFTSNPGVLGGEHDFIPDVFGSDVTGEFLSTGESFQANFNYPGSGFGGANFIYDGVDRSHNRDFRGLGGIDLTNGGQLDQFVVTVNNVEGTWFLQIFIHTDENNFFGGGGELPTGGPFPQDVIFPFDSFNSVGSPDLTDTGLIGVFLQNSPGAGEQQTSVELDSIGLR